MKKSLSKMIQQTCAASAMLATTLLSAETVWILDFEDPSHVGWFQEEMLHAEAGSLPESLDPAYLKDFPARYLVEIERTAKPEGEGHALGATFAPGEGGYADYRLLFFNLSRMGLTDWRGWDALEFDVYNPYDRTVNLRANAHGQGGGTPERPGQRPLGTQVLSHTFSLPPGWSTLSVSLHGPWRGLAPEAVQRGSMSNFWLGLIGDAEQEPVTLYLDNIRKVRALPKAVEDVIGQLQSLEELTKTSMPSSTGQFDAMTVSRLIDKAEGIAANANNHPSREEWDALREELVVVQSSARELAEAYVGASLGHLAYAVAPMLREEKQGHHLRPIGQAVWTEEEQRLAGLEQIHTILKRDLAIARLQVRMEKRFHGEDFAVGITEFPEAYFASPKDYAGPLGTEVSIAAARNEFEPFQIMILPFDGQPLHGVRITPSALNGPGTIGVENIEIAPMGWQWMPDEQRWLATMLRPDVTQFDVVDNIQQPVWVNVYVPKETPPGEYSGTLTITATDKSPIQIDLNLTVWPFTLPDETTFITAGATVFNDDFADDYARFLTAHRWNPHALYVGGEESFHDSSLDNFRRWREWGGGFFNLFWINHGYKEHPRMVVRDDEGRLAGASDHAKQSIFRAVDPILKPVLEEDPEMLRHFVIYGFDEPVAEHMPVLEDLFGAIKERYGDGLTTYFATHYPLWDQYGIADNIDIWAVTPDNMTVEARDRLHDAGRKILVYNIYSSHKDSVGNRAQFWSYYKDGYDGVLHYNPGTTGGEGVGRTGVGRMSNPWGKGLFPEDKRIESGLHRTFPDRAETGTSPFGWRYGKRTMSTVAFEYWREGLEDIDYLAVLRKWRDRLEQEGSDNRTARQLLDEADRLLGVPDTIAVGGLSGQVEVVGEIIVGMSGITKDMQVILETRERIARLIIAIRQHLNEE